MVKVPILILFSIILFSFTVADVYGLEENGIIEMPFTENSPIIDGKWTTETEWEDASNTFVNGYEHEMVILAKHDREFLYIMADMITDDFTNNSLIRNGERDGGDQLLNVLTICIDTENSGGNERTSKDYCFHESTYWYDGKLEDASLYGVIKGDPANGNDEGVRQVSEPRGYKSAESLSSVNDPFESGIDHRTYEFQIPLSFIQKSDVYGITVMTYLFLEDDDTDNDYRVYIIDWPENADKHTPSSYGSITAIDNTVTAPPLPVIKSSANELDFGKVEISKKSNVKSVTISNDGTGLLIVKNIKIPYGFSINGANTPINLESGQRFSFDVVFAPIMIEKETGTLKIASNDPNKRILYISLKGDGVETGTTLTGGGGCLIATATYGSELSPQVQQLRELRDNIILNTKSGTAFMTGFNQFYYSFSPTIADWERQNQVFKEIVKVTITPMLTSLSILNHADIDSDEEMMGYGIGIILFNIGMYFGIPVFTIMKLRKIR